MKNKTLNKYEGLIVKGEFSERELISFRKYINGASNLNEDDRERLIYAFNELAEEKGIRLHSSQQVKGYLWLNKNTYKKNGDIRKTPVLGFAERKVLKNWEEFTCVGLYNLSQNSYANYVPIYRCIDSKGNYFDYICKMIGGIEVIALGDSHGPIAQRNWPGFEQRRNGAPELRLVVS